MVIFLSKLLVYQRVSPTPWPIPIPKTPSPNVFPHIWFVYPLDTWILSSKIPMHVMILGRYSLTSSSYSKKYISYHLLKYSGTLYQHIENIFALSMASRELGDGSNPWDWAILGPLPDFHRAEPRLGILFLGIAIVLGHSVEGMTDGMSWRSECASHDTKRMENRVKCRPNVIQMSSKCLSYTIIIIICCFVDLLFWSIWTIPHDVLWRIRRSGFVLPVWLSLIWCIWDLPEWTIIHHTHPCRDTGIVCLNAVWHGISQHLGVLAYKFLDCRKNVLCLARVWYNVYIYTYNYRRKFRSQTSDNMDRWKAEQGRGREKRKIRREKSRRERVRRKKMEMREKVGKSRFTVFFQWFVAPESRKVGSLKRRVRGASWPEERWKIARRCGAKHISKSKMYKTHHVRTTFGSWDVEKVHAVLARSTFRSQNVQSTPGSDHFWRLRCRIKCTPWWREAHFQVKTHKAHHVRTIFGGSDVVSRGRRKGLWTLSKVSKAWGFCSIFNYNHHYTTLHSKTLHYTTTTPSLHSTTLHSTTLHCTQLHSITLHYTTLHYTPLHYTTLHYTTLHYTTLPSTTLRYITLHSTTLQLHLQLHSTTLNYATLHYTTLHSTTLHYTTLHYTTLHCTEWHCTTDRQVDR